MDIVIRRGTVFDGVSADPIEADVGIRDGRIAQIGSVDARGTEEIDAKGHVVTPGFVDIHTHYDGQAIWSDRLSPSSSNGITTAVMGSCGVGFAPCRREDRDLLLAVTEGVEDIPDAVMSEGLSWEWETYPEYLDALECRPHDIDIASLLPHMPLRIFAMGQRGADREPATAADLDAMYQLTREAVAAGALGVSTSQLFTHRTRDGHAVPTFGVAEQELHVIASALRDGGGGQVWQASAITNMENGSASDDLAMFSRVVATGQASGSFSLGQSNWRALMEEVSRANAAGQRIRAQVYPRRFGLYVNFDLTIHPFCLCPSFRAIMHLPMEQKLVRLRDPAFRATLLTEEPIDIGQPFHAIGRNFETMYLVGEVQNYEPPADMSIAAIARARGVDPLAYVYDLLLEDDGATMLFLQYTNYADRTLDSVLDMLRHSDSVLGLADAGAHYGMICDGAYPSFMLSYWARDRARGRLGFGETIKMLTSEPAEAMRLLDRGRLAVGDKADLNVIDPDRINLFKPRIVRDLPAGGKRLAQRTEGYAATIVNGRTIRRDDADTFVLPGKLIRGIRPAPQVRS
ncbi:N-acyl-D-amino-acid deacylase family protein [Sphingomonas solaris]|uniref:Amidohydrolase family protein n=1 Tax=Alterirhizorhabdus solaris TaxID=2529389 RepID=A0A558R9A5_9SPHN|nr:amidohydrolase family protein [Sphingomonas solaris]TVV75965.1 amidohydrolase family protein [Sphingomonas solaris]